MSLHLPSYNIDNIYKLLITNFKCTIIAVTPTLYMINIKLNSNL